MTTITHEEQLYKIFNNVNDWLKFAEAKNVGLLTLNAVIVFGIIQINFKEGSIIEKAGFYILIPFAITSFLTALISLFPILSKIEKGIYVKNFIDSFSNSIDQEKKIENIHFYGYLKTINENEFENKFLFKIGSTHAFSQYEKELANQIIHNSRIAWLKYQLFKIGAFFFLFGIVVFIIALPIMKIFF